VGGQERKVWRLGDGRQQWLEQAERPAACMGKKEADYPLRRLPAHFYREAYRLAVLRGDSAPLDFLLERQQNGMVIPEVWASRIYKDSQRLRGQR
jgi:hypothetical protein